MIEIPTEKPVIVVNSIFSTDSIWSVQVSQSLPIKISDSLVKYITDATVNILDSAGNLVDELKPVQNRYVSSSGKKPIVGGTYKLRVESKESGSVSATSYIPDTATFKSTTVSKGKSIDKRYNLVADFLLFECILKDNPYTTDYYIVELIGIQPEWNLMNKNEIEGNDNYFESFPSTVSQQTRAFFNDLTFNGQEKKIKLKTNIGSFGFSSLPPELMPDFYIRLYSVSEQLYKYLVSYYRQADSFEFEYTNQPVRVENNVINGLGIFGGYTYKDIPVDKIALANLLQ